MRLYLAILCTLLTSLAHTTCVIGISGGSGSGKTTLAMNIVERFQGLAVVLSQDSYYKDQGHLTQAQRAQLNFDHPDAIDFVLLRQHILALKEGRAIEQPIYNFSTHAREAEVRTIQPAPILIVEGILLLAIPQMRELFDLKVYVDTDGDIRLLRRIERDMAMRGRNLSSVRDQYLTSVKPMHDLYVEPSKQHADMIVPNGGTNRAALAVLASKLKEELAFEEMTRQRQLALPETAATAVCSNESMREGRSPPSQAQLLGPQE